MPKSNLLNNIVGYQEGSERIIARQKVGSDFSDQKWKTASEIAKLQVVMVLPS